MTDSLFVAIADCLKYLFEHKSSVLLREKLLFNYPLEKFTTCTDSIIK